MGRHVRRSVASRPCGLTLSFVHYFTVDRTTAQLSRSLASSRSFLSLDT